MSMPLRSLPVVQNWDCHSCGSCCREYAVAVTDEERHRIEALGWDEEPLLAGKRPFVQVGPWWSRRWRLNERADGACVFLTEQNRCRIHELHGPEAKPLACRLFPFILVPVGDHWHVGLRFACPSAAADRGRPVAESEPEVRRWARMIEEREGLGDQVLPPPPLQPGQLVGWPDLLRFQQAVLALLRDRRDRVERRLRKCLALANLCRQARFEQVTGGKLAEFLDVLRGSLDDDVPANPEDVPPPTWVGRVLFRQLLAVYARKDRGNHKGAVTRNRLTLLRAAWRFARGRGPVPRLNGLLPATTFAQIEASAGALPAAAEEVLERYYLVKVASLQFCGPTQFRLPFWDGLESLAVTLPAILWLARAFSGVDREQAIVQAVSLVDDHFGYNRLLGSRRFRFPVRLLARRGELEKLIAWYGK
jgi:lysine-N-methylase